MLQIASDLLPQSELSYTAFRLAFSETWERLTLARQIGTWCDGFGYLMEVPFLRGVPPHIQLDLLAATWRKHATADTVSADLVDESVIYAACETAARLVEQEPHVSHRYLRTGPQEVQCKFGESAAAELRLLHLNLSNEGEFLIISQFEDLPPEESRKIKADLKLDDGRLEVMFDVLSRWHLSPEFARNLNGLLTRKEMVRLADSLNIPVT